MNIKEKLEKQLAEVEHMITMYKKYDEFSEWIKLNRLKVSILQGLQKYEPVMPKTIDEIKI